MINFNEECYVLFLGKIVGKDAVKEKRILHLPIIKRYFDLIKAGEKKEEYREIKSYWTKRFKDFLVQKPFDYICFRNGYGRKVPHIFVELIDINFGISKKEYI